MIAAKVQAALSCSGRAVCRWLSISRSTLNYQPKPLPERKLKLELEIVRISQAHPTLGYKKITRKLVELGYGVNKKQVQRIRREEGLQVPPPKPRQRRRGVSTGMPQQAGHQNHVWAWDFVSDYTERGGKLRTFNLLMNTHGNATASMRIGRSRRRMCWRYCRVPLRNMERLNTFAATTGQSSSHK